MPTDIISQLKNWGEQQADIRAMLLTSTRAIAGAMVDHYSDYDVVLITKNVDARYEDRAWLSAFGEVVIDYWDPLAPDEGSGLETSGSIVYYPGTLKIDFTLWPIEQAHWLATKSALPTELDAGYLVLIDKDHLTANWPGNTGVGYRAALPDAATYRTLINDFFIGVPYVITALIRGEVLPAKWVLDYDMRYVYLLPMLEWYVYCHAESGADPAKIEPIGDDIRIGANGKHLQRYLPNHLWRQFQNTYADTDLTANRRALHAMIALFREVAVAVGESIGEAYPQSLHDRVLAHIATLENTA